jgi:hypothetical protein
MAESMRVVTKGRLSKSLAVEFRASRQDDATCEI